jgi:ribosome maturation factor RimP
MNKDVTVSLRDRLSAIVETMGYEFVGCELLRQGRSGLLRVYIDNEKGITVDDCSLVSRQVSAMLDVEDPIQGQYTLEISSPGMDRPLFELKQFEKYVGNKVKMRLYSPLGDRRNLMGMLVSVEGSNIQVEVDGEALVVPFANIEKAKLVPEF